MRARQAIQAAREQQKARERSLQTGAALALALLVLAVIVLRAALHDTFSPGWWRH